MLPHFNLSNQAIMLCEPIHANLYEISFILNDENKFEQSDLLYIKENIIKYNLNKGKICITLNFNEHNSIKTFTNIFNNIKHTIIELHDITGRITRRIMLDMLDESLVDFSFKQDYSKRDELVELEVILKYSEILSEEIK